MVIMNKFFLAERLWILGKYNKISEDIIDAVSKEYEGISVKNITCPLPPPTTTVQPVTTTTPESVATNPTSVTSTPNDNDNNNETTTSAEDITTLDPGDDKGNRPPSYNISGYEGWKFYFLFQFKDEKL